jgi:hypothetical protein
MITPNQKAINSLVIIAFLGTASDLWGQGLALLDTEQIEFEKSLTNLLEHYPSRRKTSSIIWLKGLKLFARQEASLALQKSQGLKGVHQRIKRGNMSQGPYYVQLAYGRKPAAALRQLFADRGLKKFLNKPSLEGGLGAVRSPQQKDVFQVVIFVRQQARGLGALPGLSRQQTDTVIGHASPSLQKCYDQTLNRNPNLQSNFSVKFVIGAQGQSIDFKILKSLPDKSFEVCLYEVFQNLRFPSPRDGLVVTLIQPFSFSPPQGKEHVGWLSPDEIKNTLKGWEESIQTCYKKSDKAAEKKGQLLWVLNIDADGKVLKASFDKDTIGSRSLQSCLIGLSLRITFPKPKFNASLTVRFPLSFSP